MCDKFNSKASKKLLANSKMSFYREFELKQNVILPKKMIYRNKKNPNQTKSITFVGDEELSIAFIDQTVDFVTEKDIREMMK